MYYIMYVSPNQSHQITQFIFSICQFVCLIPNDRIGEDWERPLESPCHLKIVNKMYQLRRAYNAIRPKSRTYQQQNQ